MPSNTLSKVVFRQNDTSTEYNISNCTIGYYNENDGIFYFDPEMTESPIDPIPTLLYVDLNTDYLYIYDDDSQEYLLVGGTRDSRDPIKYVDVLPSYDDGVENIIYGTIARANYNKTIAANFLDKVPEFTKYDIDENSYEYWVTDGCEVEASLDGENYKRMLTIAYDNDTSEWTLMYIDFETETPVAGNTFYYRVVQRDFYAGNKDENTVTLIASNDLDRQSLYVGGVGIDITNDRVSLKPAQSTIIGGVMPDNVTTTVDEYGVLSGQYYGGYGIDVEDNKISTTTFVGTQAEWDALPNSTKNYYTSVNITDDHTQVSDDIPGHIIYDEDNNEQLQRGKLKFIDFTITDDSTNDMTVVEHNPYIAGDKIEIDDHTINCDDTVKSTFVGTREEWQSLTTEQKAKYEIVNLTDDLASGGTIVVDAVVRGNMNAVTSNAVAKYVSQSSGGLENIIDSPTSGNIGGIVQNATKEIENYNLLGMTVKTIPNIASGDFATAEGLSFEAEQSGTVFTTSTIASGIGSHAEGIGTTASTIASHSEGMGTEADGMGSHAEGSYTKSTNNSHAEGTDTTANGQASHAEGRQTIASGNMSHAEGLGTTATNQGAHAEGYHTIANESSSHAEGAYTLASGGTSHTEGTGTTANELASHAEGWYTGASSTAAHAEGYHTIAAGFASHASGSNTSAGYDNQTVIGEYNDNKANTLFEVGNGTADNARSNAFAIKQDGTFVFANGTEITPAQFTQLLGLLS